MKICIEHPGLEPIFDNIPDICIEAEYGYGDDLIELLNRGVTIKEEIRPGYFVRFSKIPDTIN